MPEVNDQDRNAAIRLYNDFDSQPRSSTQTIELFAKYFAEQRHSIMTNTPPPIREPRLIIHATTPTHTKVFVGSEVIGMIQKISIQSDPYLPCTEVTFPDFPATPENQKTIKTRDKYIALVQKVYGVHVILQRYLDHPDGRENTPERKISRTPT